MHAIFDQGPPPPCPAPFNMAGYVLQAGLETPDKIALAVVTPTGAERWSYARLTAAILGTATGLLDQGLEPGDRVLMRLGNTVEFPITYLAALSVDLIPVPDLVAADAPRSAASRPRSRPGLIVAEPGVSLPDPLPCPVLDTDALAADARPAAGELRRWATPSVPAISSTPPAPPACRARWPMPTGRSGRGG